MSPVVRRRRLGQRSCRSSSTSSRLARNVLRMSIEYSIIASLVAVAAIVLPTVSVTGPAPYPRLARGPINRIELNFQKNKNRTELFCKKKRFKTLLRDLINTTRCIKKRIRSNSPVLRLLRA